MAKKKALETIAGEVASEMRNMDRTHPDDPVIDYHEAAQRAIAALDALGYSIVKFGPSRVKKDEAAP